MSFARVEKTPAGFIIKPHAFGVAFGAFKKQGDADLAAAALNRAYEAGQERVKGDFRLLIGAASEADGEITE